MNVNPLGSFWPSILQDAPNIQKATIAFTLASVVFLDTTRWMYSSALDKIDFYALLANTPLLCNQSLSCSSCLTRFLDKNFSDLYIPLTFLITGIFFSIYEHHRLERVNQGFMIALKAMGTGAVGGYLGVLAEQNFQMTATPAISFSCWALLSIGLLSFQRDSLIDIALKKIPLAGGILGIGIASLTSKIWTANLNAAKWCIVSQETHSSPAWIDNAFKDKAHLFKLFPWIMLNALTIPIAVPLLLKMGNPFEFREVMQEENIPLLKQMQVKQLSTAAAITGAVLGIFLEIPFETPGGALPAALALLFGGYVVKKVDSFPPHALSRVNSDLPLTRRLYLSWIEYPHKEALLRIFFTSLLALLPTTTLLFFPHQEGELCRDARIVQRICRDLLKVAFGFVGGSLCFKAQARFGAPELRE